MTVSTEAVSEESIRMFRTLQIHAPNALEVEADPPGEMVELHQRLLDVLYGCLG